MTPEQVMLARKALRWARDRLAVFSGVSVTYIARYENSGTVTDDDLAAIRRALEAAGVEFIAENGGGAGVRLRKAT